MTQTSWMCAALKRIKRQDRAGLESFLTAHVPLATLLKATRSRNLNHVKLACVCLSLVGDHRCQEDLAACLKRGDKNLSSLAEHALWSVWFRSGPTPEANRLLAEAVSVTTDGHYESTLQKLGDIVLRWPNFAEAYNQRAIVHFLSGQYDRSIEDCQAALRLNPRHFGALAGLGHCHAHAGRLPDAMACYEAALAIHPDLDCIRVGCEQIQQLLDSSADTMRPQPARPDIFLAEHI